MTQAIKDFLIRFIYILALFTIYMGVLWIARFCIYRFVTPSQPMYGILVWIADAFFSPIFLIGSGLILFLGFIAYMTQTVSTRSKLIANQMTQELQYSSSQLEVLYDNGPVPYFMVWPDGTIVSPNKATLRFFNVTPEKIQGVNFLSLVVEDDSPHKQSLMLQAKLKARVKINQEEVQIKLFDGSLRWVLLSVIDIATVGEHPHVGLVTLVDITLQKNIDQIKTEFVSLASHQLRTPLSTVKWQIEMLLTGKQMVVNEEARKLLDSIHSANERMIGLVNELLNVSRIETGKVPMEKKETDLKELSDGILEELKGATTVKQTVIKTSFDGNMVITTDPSLIRIVIQNLLSNAVRYIQEGGTVELNISRNIAGCEIKITDNGCGIPDNEKDRIFSKMFRAVNAKKIEPAGTGLGLYMSKAFVERLGGTIGFESEVGKGSVFTVHLPTH